MHFFKSLKENRNYVCFQNVIWYNLVITNHLFLYLTLFYVNMCLVLYHRHSIRLISLHYLCKSAGADMSSKKQYFFKKERKIIMTKNIKVYIIGLSILCVFIAIAIFTAITPTEVATMQTTSYHEVHTPNEKAQAYECFYEVIKDDVYYLVAEDMSVAFVWNTSHNYMPHLNVSTTHRDIPMDLLVNAENFFV